MTKQGGTAFDLLLELHLKPRLPLCSLFCVCAAFNPSVAAAIYAAAITAQVMAASAFGFASKPSAALPPPPPFPYPSAIDEQLPGFYPPSPYAPYSYMAEVQQAQSQAQACLDPLTLQRIYYSAANAASAAAALQQPQQTPWSSSLHTSPLLNQSVADAALGYAEHAMGSSGVVTGAGPYRFYDRTRSSLESVAARQPSGSFSSISGVARGLQSIPSLPEGDQQQSLLFRDTERHPPPASGESLFEQTPTKSSPLSLHKIASTSAVQGLAGGRCGPIAPPQRSQSASRLSLDPAHATGLAKAVGEFHHFSDFAKQFEAFAGREDPQEADGAEGSSAGRFFLGGGP